MYISRSSYLRLLDVRIIDKCYHTWYTWLLKSMCVHAYNLHACLGAHVHAGNHGGQRRTLGVIPSVSSYLFSFVSEIWSGTHSAVWDSWPVIARVCPAFLPHHWDYKHTLSA